MRSSVEDRVNPGKLLRDLPRAHFNPRSSQSLAWSKGPTTYLATHERTQPPPDQVVVTEKTNILLRQFHQLAEAKRDRAKRAASELPQSQPSKMPKPCKTAWV
mmetsp:Transcript_36367/g.60263  ORF Transcript_36367/g.60263 Transcript_36367/m.60263 type:complete len:103 (+) Transcript_36367:24-332(+)|eukprot:CAMPEP_0119315102 /NCGR_PEP_ID=MMETSP1333-20130426/34465_1 /TAXON_ID=418940 /ORGANISM="Scyphosphaera apsteinii, Strain RCC1455" /LENGTH=102 /DNA_ID=CAMNT_0007320341 /DNA_START=21 /DNA_END=329 /DNA_ORIENTATION=+